MAHNPSYVGKTHVVTRTHEAGTDVIGVHGDYGSARNAIEKHAKWGPDKPKRSGNKKEGYAYHHPDDMYGDLQTYYEIHREGPNGYEKV